jgi:hypothetical protein
MRHWIGMAGLRGYMPNYCDVWQTKEDAIEGLLFIHDDALIGPPRVKTALRRFEFVEIDLHKWGNEYLEIMPCNCDEPWVHSEDGEKADWMVKE